MAEQAPKQETFPEPTEVIYADGGSALEFTATGHTIELGFSSPLKYARHLQEGGIDYAVVITESGNRYGIGDGLVYNNNKRRVEKLPDDIPPIVIGQNWEIGRDTTTSVKSVELRYKHYGEAYKGESDRVNPFPGLEEMLRKVHDTNPDL